MLSTKFWTKGDVGEVSIDSLCTDEVGLPRDDAEVSIDSLRSEDAELADARVEGSDTREYFIDTDSLSSSSVDPIWRNSGCWLQIARNVSLQICMSHIAIELKEGHTNACANAKKLCSIALCSLMRS